MTPPAVPRTREDLLADLPVDWPRSEVQVGGER